MTLRKTLDESGVGDVKGGITVRNPLGVKKELGDKMENVSLKIKEAK